MGTPSDPKIASKHAIDTHDDSHDAQGPAGRDQGEAGEAGEARQDHDPRDLAGARRVLSPAIDP